MEEALEIFQADLYGGTMGVIHPDITLAETLLLGTITIENTQVY